MAYGPRSFRHVLFEGMSANSSNRTSNAALIADARQITLSVQTVAAVASVYSVHMTNANGFSSAIAEGDWSNVSGVQRGVFTLDPGARFLRVIRPATDSLGTVIVHARS